MTESNETLPVNHAEARVDAFPSGTVQPNEFDLRRIVQALDERTRYRYVVPLVRLGERGYRISSACCSRRIDPQGGEIDIVWIEYRADGWRLHSRNHAEGRWVLHAEFARLHELLAHLNRDPGRVFWP